MKSRSFRTRRCPLMRGCGNSKHGCAEWCTWNCVPSAATEWNTGIDADRHLNADKRLRHMPTPENDPLSYISFSQLTHLVRDHWDAFACYLPPQDIWLAKLEEIGQIRNRIAHFRSGHTDDYPRVLQFLRDLDRGFWSFCTSYNDPEPILPAADDPVTSHFLTLRSVPVDGNPIEKMGPDRTC